MIINKNIIIADDGKYLVTKYSNPVKSLVLGNHFTKDGVVEISLSDVTEVIPVELDKLYYVKDTNEYSILVTELIRLKYSIDDELALINNSRIENTSEKEIEFLNWRSLCKKVANEIING